MNATQETPKTHTPCCSSHGVDMTCETYRRTHFVEVGPCCEHYRPTVEDVARRIVNRLAADWNVPVDVRQATNWESTDTFVADLIRQTHPKPAAPVDERALMAAGIISASAAQRVLALEARHNGKAEHTDFAEWLEQFAESLLNQGK